MISVGRLAEFSNLTNATAPKSSEQASAQKTTTMASDNNDKFVRSETTFAPAYTRATVTENSAGRTRGLASLGVRMPNRPAERSDSEVTQRASITPLPVHSGRQSRFPASSAPRRIGEVSTSRAVPA